MIEIHVYFDEVHMDNIYVDTLEEAYDVIESVQRSGFSEYNGDVKEDWFKMGRGDNPMLNCKIKS